MKKNYKKINQAVEKYVEKHEQEIYNHKSVNYDLRALCHYADQHGKKPADLTFRETSKFLTF